MSYLFQALLTFTSTAWMLIVYKISSSTKFTNFPALVEDLICIVLLFLITLLSLQCTKKLSPATCDECDSFTLADNEFLPVYLGYFFVALSIKSGYSLCFIYVIVFVFTYVLNMYFNPIFILLGYHYYHITTKSKTYLFVICKSHAPNPTGLTLKNLRYINDSTLITHEE